MGEARRNKMKPELDTDLLNQIGRTLRKLATAASSNLGRDCYLHSALGQQLFLDAGLPSQIHAGFAAWRVGEADGAVVSHVPAGDQVIPEGLLGLPYHAWLSVAGVIVDFTGYQLQRKMRELDEADGGETKVEWCPELLVLRPSQVARYYQVAQGGAGLAYYERHKGIEELLAETYSLDQADLTYARLIMLNPGVNVVGPNQG